MQQSLIARASALSLSSYIPGDLKSDKETAHLVRIGFVQKAIDSALRGNASEWLAAQALTVKGRTCSRDDAGALTHMHAGKACEVVRATKADAYATAFAAVGRPERFPYTGKLTAETARAIAERAAELAAQWSDAFIMVLPLTKAERTQAEKDAAKAEKDAKFAKAAAEWAESQGYVKAADADKGHSINNLTPTALADVVADMVRAGAFNVDNLRVIHGAVAPLVKAADKAAKDAKAADKAAKVPAGADA